MGTHKLTGLAAGTTVGDSVRYEQVADVAIAGVHAATTKATPVDADELPLSDSAATYGLKKLTWANLKATLKTYFDTVYTLVGLGVTASTTELNYSTGVTSSIQTQLAAKVAKGTTGVLTVGYSTTPYNAGTKSSGTFTPDEANGGMQYAVNGGAHTLAPPTNNTSMVIQYTNNGSAGAITTSGFTKVSGAFTTTNGDDFFCYITVCNGFKHLNIQALQ